VTIDYRVRGFTRDVQGKKHYIDHEINSIQNYLSDDTRRQYQMIDVNVYQESIFHTKMLLKECNLDNYVFGTGVEALSPEEQRDIRTRLRQEMLEIFYGRNFQGTDTNSF
jgi:S-adenosylmethionine decarboxylase